LTRVCSIFSQILQLIPRVEFEATVRKYRAERHARGFSSWGQFVAMLFCHLGHAKSLREICGGLAASEGKLRHLGVPTAPSRSTLAYANEHRPWQLYEAVFHQLLGKCQALVASQTGNTLGKGDGTFTAQPVFQAKATAGNALIMGWADFNGDGKLDLFAVQDGGYIWMTLGNGDGTFVQTPITIGTGNMNLALVGDFDLDHQPDLAIGDSTNIFDRRGITSTGVATLLNVSAPAVPSGFQMSASALSPSTVTAGSSVTSKITVSPMDAFGGDVTFSCSNITLNGSPATTMPPVCSFSPNPIKGASGTTTLKVSTTPASSARLVLRFGRQSGWSYAVFLPIFGIVIGTGLKFNRKKAQGFLLLTLMLSGLILMACCGGNGGSGVKTGSGGTPAGTYTITMTGSANGATSRTTTLPLIVQ
jgi:hypothetical protein